MRKSCHDLLRAMENRSGDFYAVSQENLYHFLSELKYHSSEANREAKVEYSSVWY